MAVERTTIVTPSGPATGSSSGHYVDWPAIFAGAVVATAIAVVFAGFGAAIGLAALSPQPGEGSAKWSLILTGAWALLTVLASYGVGGYVAGRMRRRFGDATADEVSARDAMHGMVVWGLGVLIGTWIATSAVTGAVNAVGNVASATASAAGSVVQGAASAVGTVAQGAGSAISSAVGAATDAAGGTPGGDGGIDLSGFDPIAAINNRLLRGTGGAIDPNAAANIAPVARDVIYDVARTGELSDANRTLLVEAVSANTTLTEPEVNARIDQAVTDVSQLRDEAAQRFQQVQDAANQAVEQAAQAARDAADAARKAAVLAGFLVAAALAIALGAAMWGAGIGGSHRDEGRLWRGFRSY